MLRRLLIALCLTLAVCPTLAAAPAGTKWALLVGVDEYDNPEVSRLQYTVADVGAVADALTATAGFPKDQVVRLTTGGSGVKTRPTNVEVLKRLDRLAKQIRPEDTFLFYFSGHGFSRADGQNFLGTVNADPATPQTLALSTVALSQLQEKMAGIRARQVVFIIDACRNDPERGKGDAPNLLSRGFSRDLVRVAQAGGGGLTGTAVLFACAEGERAYEWPEKKHGAFTYFLVDGLRGKAADGNGDLTVNGLAAYVQQEVLKWGVLEGKSQTPHLTQDGAARILLARIKKSAPVPGNEPSGEAVSRLAGLLADHTACVYQGTASKGASVPVRSQGLLMDDRRLGVLVEYAGGRVPDGFPRGSRVPLAEIDPDSISVRPAQGFTMPVYQISVGTIPGGSVDLVTVEGKSVRTTLLRIFVDDEKVASEAAAILRRHVAEVRRAAVVPSGSEIRPLPAQVAEILGGAGALAGRLSSSAFGVRRQTLQAERGLLVWTVEYVSEGGKPVPAQLIRRAYVRLTELTPQLISVESTRFGLDIYAVSLPTRADDVVTLERVNGERSQGSAIRIFLRGEDAADQVAELLRKYLAPQKAGM